MKFINFTLDVEHVSLAKYLNLQNLSSWKEGVDGMLFAIDNYEVGKQREISASEVINDRYRFRSERFICPECNEIVTLVDRINAEPYFRHGNRTETSPECDKRVDGRSGLSIYERVGLPIYLKRDLGDSFKLYIGFSPLGQALLKQAFNNKERLIIGSRASGWCQERSFFITPTSFYEDQTTLIPIDFVPINGHNYSISYSGSSISAAIHKVWSDYADGFSNIGAIFSFSESGGKKIRRGDSITTEKDYYVVAKHFSSYFSEISNRVVGTVSLNNTNYKVYVININVSINNLIQFKRIGDFLKTAFGVWLLGKTPELITLWPPVIENEGFIPVLPSTVIYSSVISGNDMPLVYIYTGTSSSKTKVNYDCYGNHTISLQFYGSEIVVSVDRKYVGHEVIYRRKQLALPHHCYSLSVSDRDGKTIDPDIPLPASIIKEGILLSINAKVELYHKNHDERYQHILIRNAESINIHDLNIFDSLYIYAESRRIFSFTFAKPEYSSNRLDDLSLFKGLILNSKGSEVSTPGWVRLFIILAIELGYKKFGYALKQMTISGKLRIGTLRYLAYIKESINA